MADTWDQSHRELVARTLKLRTKEELDLLEHLAVSKNLDPLAGELLMFNGRTPITSINGATKLCADELDGIDVEFYTAEGDSFPVWLQDAPPAACSVSVWRKGRTRPFTASCRFKDYKGPGKPWSQMPSTMIRKCALAAALRLGFADRLAGIYAKEEMDQAGGTSNEPEQRIAQVRKPEPASEPLPEKTTDGTTSQEVAADAKASEPPGLEPQKFKMKSIQVLYDRCAKLGMTPTGWKTLCNQLGAKTGADIPPNTAQQITAKLTPDDVGVEKIMLLNSGRPTTAQPVTA